MLVIEAPNELDDIYEYNKELEKNGLKKINSTDSFVKCFLAGGITRTENWQEEVIKHLQNDYSLKDTKYLIIYNPRRSNFDANKKDESRKQIEWEAKHLIECDILSFYFAGSESPQPITLYEFGRYPLLKVNQNKSWEYPIIKQTLVSIEDGYKREDDVICQNRMACNVPIYQHSSPALHSQLIYNAYQYALKTRR